MKSIKINFIFSIIKSVMAIIFPIISFPYASRILGVENIGKVQYAQSVISYFALFASLGISFYAIREGTKVRNDREKLSKLSKELLIINLLSTGIVYIIFFICILLSCFDGYILLMSITSLSILFTTLGIEWLYQLEEDYIYISLRSVILQILSMLFLFLFVKSKNDYFIYAFIIVFANNGAFFLNFINSKKYVDFFKRTDLDLQKHIKPILLLFSINIASSIYLNLDVIMIRIFKNDYYVGLYTVAMKVNTIVRSLISSICIVTMPRLTYYLSKGNKSKYNNLLKKVINFNLTLTIPSAVGMILLSKEIILILSGFAYLPAEMTSRILAINIVFAALDGLIYQQILIPFEMENAAAVGTMLGALMNVILNAILIQLFSIEGAAIASCISELTVFSFFIFSLKKKIDFKNIFKSVFKNILACLGIVFVICILRKLELSSIVFLFLSITASVVIYFIILFFLKYFLIVDSINQMKRIINSKK